MELSNDDIIRLINSEHISNMNDYYTIKNILLPSLQNKIEKSRPLIYLNNHIFKLYDIYKLPSKLMVDNIKIYKYIDSDIESLLAFTIFGYKIYYSIDDNLDMSWIIQYNDHIILSCRFNIVSYHVYTIEKSNDLKEHNRFVFTNISLTTSEFLKVMLIPSYILMPKIIERNVDANEHIVIDMWYDDIVSNIIEY